jgi:hypothetical protein
VPYLSKALWIQAARTTSLTGFVMQTWDGVGEPKISYAGTAAAVRLPEGRSPLHARLQRGRIGGGSAVTASLYVVSLGEYRLRGLQLRPMEVATSACCRTARPTART